MKRTLSVERLYNLGNFINIKIVNTIEEVPEEIANSPEKIQLLYRNLGTECDLAYQEYKAVNVTIDEGKKEGKNVKEMLEQERDRIAQELEAGEAGDK